MEALRKAVAQLNRGLPKADRPTALHIHCLNGQAQLLVGRLDPWQGQAQIPIEDRVMSAEVTAQLDDTPNLARIAAGDNGASGDGKASLHRAANIGHRFLKRTFHTRKVLMRCPCGSVKRHQKAIALGHPLKDCDDGLGICPASIRE
jgi:hypothetical protein